MRYRLMVLPDSDMMNPMVLQKIADLVGDGATVVGRRPSRAYGLQDYPHNDSLIVDVAGRLWGDCNHNTGGHRSYGSGRTICNITERQVLLQDGVQPDFEYRSSHSDADIDFIHRRVATADGDADIYFVINSDDVWEEVECAFRIVDRRPELWDAATDAIDYSIVHHRDNGRTMLPLRLAPYGSAYIVFREPAVPVSVASIRHTNDSVLRTGGYRVNDVPAIDLVSMSNSELVTETWRSGDYRIELSDGRELSSGSVRIPEPVKIDGPWEIQFAADRGAPDTAMCDQLSSRTESEVEGIKHFSGTAVYHTEFLIDPESLNEETVFYLDLGVVKDLAEVVLNSQRVPVLWKAPYRVNVTDWLSAGPNELAIAVTNLWPNRLIGDQKLPPEERIGVTNIAKFKKASPLLESGLIGPVQIYRVSRQRMSY